jgi:predicted RNase H-like HicB family nuclease
MDSLRIIYRHEPEGWWTVAVRFEDGSLWATVDELPGAFATGDSLSELKESLQEAISFYRAAPEDDPVPVTLG